MDDYEDKHHTHDSSVQYAGVYGSSSIILKEIHTKEEG